LKESFLCLISFKGRGRKTLLVITASLVEGRGKEGIFSPTEKGIPAPVAEKNEREEGTGPLREGELREEEGVGSERHTKQKKKGKNLS